MPAELQTKDEPTAPSPVAAATDSESELREWARQHVERVHRLRMHVAAYLIGMVVLTPIWAFVEWQDNGGFKRFDWSDDGDPGDWEPWIVYIAVIWGLIVLHAALKTHFDRPTTEEEIDREVRRVTLRDRR